MQKNFPNILFIDDEERILRSIASIFWEEDYNVLTTTDANEALSLLEKQNIHVLVSDQRMPMMLGMDLLKKAREISPNTVRLLLTGYADTHSAIQCVNEGEIFRYLTKPWQNDDLKAKIAQAIQIATHAPLKTEDKALDKAATETDIPLTILLLDDDPVSHTLLTETFGNQHNLLWAKNLDQALDFLVDQTIAVMISEINIKGQDISIALKKLKKHNPHIVTVVLTSFNDKDNLIELINQAQIYRFIPKPAHKNLLTRSIQQAVNYFKKQSKDSTLIKRHQVDEAKKTDQESGTAVKLMGVLKRIRRPA